MTFFGKTVFAVVSISALVYLVLQTSHGQYWLSETQHRVEQAPISEADIVALQETAANALRDSFSQLLKTSEHSDKIQQLEMQLANMTQQIAELHLVMDELSALNKSSNPQLPVAYSAQASLQDSVPTVQAASPLQPSEVSARQRQLEQQARLQAVVQRMELTALQAISR